MDTETIKKTIEEFLANINFDIKDITIKKNPEDGTIWCDIYTNSDPRIFIGKNAETLGAINHLVKKIIERNLNIPQDEKFKVTIDINNNQKRRIETVKATAHMMAERARYFKSNIEVDPMNSSDRRIIHEFIQGVEDLVTESIGDGFNRRVVIKYVGKN